MDLQQASQMQSALNELLRRFESLQLEHRELLARTSRPDGPRLKPPRIPMFAGEEHLLEPWLSQAGAIMSEAGMDLQDGKCVRFVALYLEKKARTVWDSRVREMHDAQGGCTTFDAFRSLLRNLLGPANSDVVGRARLRDLRQDKSVHAYLDAFLKLTRSLATPMPYLEQRELFIGGLRRGPMQFVRQHLVDASTFHDAAIAAQLYDRTMSHTAASGYESREPRSHSSPMELGHMHAVRSDSPAHSDRSSASVRSRTPSPAPRSGRNLTPYRPARRTESPSPHVRLSALTAVEREKCIAENRCFRCRKVGHVSRECPRHQKN